MLADAYIWRLLVAAACGNAYIVAAATCTVNFTFTLSEMGYYLFQFAVLPLCETIA